MKILKSILLLFVILVTTSSTYGNKWVIRRLPLNVLLRGDLSQQDNRIVGGSQAAVGEFPYQISLQRSSGASWSHSCGGSIYDANTILNAAHCVYGATASYLRVVAGEYNLLVNEGTEQIRSVSRLVYHSAFDTYSFENDIALLKLSSPLTLNNLVTPIDLPLPGSRPEDGTVTTVTGWGTIEEGLSSLPAILRKVDVPIVSDDDCTESYGEGEVLTGMICAGFSSGGKDSCQGDSGGPLVLKGTKVQIGIVSWGNGCARPLFYGVYTQVSLYIDWIELNAADEPVTTAAPTTERPSTRTTGNGGITPTIIMTTLRTTSTTYDWGYNFTFPVSSTPSRDPPVHVLLLAALVLWFFMSKN